MTGVQTCALPISLDGDRLTIAMHVRRPDGRRIFAARLTGSRRPLRDRTLLAAALRYPLMTAQVIGLIHWQALKLRIAGVPYRRPKTEAGNAISSTACTQVYD